MNSVEYNVSMTKASIDNWQQKKNFFNNREWKPNKMYSKTNLETGEQRKTCFDFNGRFQFLLFVGCQNIRPIYFKITKTKPTCSGSKSCTQTQFNLFVIKKKKIYFREVTRSTKSKRRTRKKVLEALCQKHLLLFHYWKEKKHLYYILPTQLSNWRKVIQVR